MSSYPQFIDNDSTLPAVNNNITEIGSDAINALRDAVVSIETTLGVNVQGTSSSLASRLSVLINPDGSVNTSIIYSLGLVVLPITNNQIASNANIPESKLLLDYRTQDLFNYFRDLSKDVNLALAWISASGVKLEPHLIGAIYRHDLAQIDVAEVSTQFLNNVFRVNRDNTDAYTLIGDINNELIGHQWKDGSPLANIQNIITNDGGAFPSNYAHTAGGIYLNSSRFVVIPQTAQDVQSFADFIDSSSILTLGTRIQNLYANGISRNSRSSSLTIDGYGQSLVSTTPAVAYLRDTYNLSFPFDDISAGDDIVQFFPTSDSGFTFDAQFALVRPGDIIRVAYVGDSYNIEVPYIVSEKKYIQGAGKSYFIRIAGKNIAYAPNAVARIDRPLFNNDKQGVLAIAGVNSPSAITPSLIVGSPRGAQCLGVGFSPDQFNETHYLLYLQLYPDGNPLDSVITLPAIDITGNQGTTPGAYTLDSIVSATNNAFREPGYNYRFIAFQHDGEFGIMLADSYNNASFSIISAIVNSTGFYDQANTSLNYPQNVIDVFPVVGTVAPDPLGFGPFGAGVASPPFTFSYGSTASALLPTVLFTPLRRNNFYVNGVELERLSIDVDQTLDTFGDGYWVATVENYTANNGPPGHMLVTYNVPLDLSASQLKAGKTLVVQQFGSSLGIINYGRFIIQSVVFSCCPPVTTQITVFDAVHATGSSPQAVAPIGSVVSLYFNSDSVSFNNETATDFVSLSAAFKRSFEVYIDGNANTFTHERGRISLNGTITVNGIQLYNTNMVLGQMDIVGISPTLRGYQFGPINKITLSLSSIDPIGGIITGNLASYNGITFSTPGPTTSGKIGEVIRFYDETNIDYIDVIFPLINTFPTLVNQYLDLQLFPSLQLDEEIMILASCQERTDTNIINQIQDLRQFGNTSEEELTTSALDYIGTTARLLHFNGVINGFDILINEAYGEGASLSLTGGNALVNGNFNALNAQLFVVPAVQEVYNAITYPINYALCVNSDGDLIIIVLTDYDPVLGTPNAPNRIVMVTNEVSSVSYPLDSCTFSYLLNDRKDLTALYIVSATVVGSGLSALTTITTRDVRRFVNDADASIPAVLTFDNSQGNFKSLSAAFYWLKFNNSFQNTLQVKGAFAISTDPGLNFPLTITAGGGIASLTFNGVGAINISNVTFKGITVVFNSSLTATNVNFQNCVVTFNNFTYFNNVIIDQTTINSNATIFPTNTSILNSVINVPIITQAFVLGNGCKFDRSTFNYASNPVGDGLYVTTNLVNSGSGMMYANIASGLNGITITNNIFNNTLADHYSFISLQLTNAHAVLQNVAISGNQFNSLANTNDYRAVVAITSTITSLAGSSYPFCPKLINVAIENNKCNYDQMLLLSTDRVAGQPIIGAMLTTVNVRINDNICGTIGFITAGNQISHPDDSNPFNDGYVRNKPGQLIIENNACKLITNLDSMGDFIAFWSVQVPLGITPGVWVSVNTGGVAILNNSVNWIQVGCSSLNSFGLPPGDGAFIFGNRLSPNDPIYLNQYIDTAQSGIAPSNVGIMLRGENSLVGFSQSIISHNILTQNPVAETNNSSTLFSYNAGIACFNNAQITNNTITTVVSGNSSPIIYLGFSGIMRVNNNVLNRNGLNVFTIQAYVAGFITAQNLVSIVDNTFDTQYVDALNTNNQTGFNIPTSWEFRNNVNQTFYIEFSLVEQATMLQFGSSSGTNGPFVSNPVLPLNQIETSGASPTSTQYLIMSRNLNGGAATSQYIGISDGQTAATEQDAFGKTFGIDYLIPPGVRLLTISMGAGLVAPDGEITPIFQPVLDYSVPSHFPTGSTNNCITLSVLKYIPTTFTNPNAVLNVLNNIGGVGNIDFSQTVYLFSNIPIATEAQEQAIRTETQYAVVDLSAQDFRTGQNYRMAVSVDMSFLKLNTFANQITFYLSPVVVKCVYGA